MKLVRLRNDKDPEVILDGDNESIMWKVNDLNLVKKYDTFWYDKDNPKNLGETIDGKEIFDYYVIYTDESIKWIKHEYKKLKTIETAESLGFIHRATGKDWITFTYPETNTHVILINMSCDIMKTLGDELVRCGRIQLRQQINKEFSPFNYD